MKKVILMVAIVVAGVGLGWGESTGTQSDTTKNMRDIVGKIHATKDKKERMKLQMQLLRQKPASKEEVNEFLNLLDDKDEDVREGTYNSLLMNVKDPAMAPVFRKKIKKGSIYTKDIAIKKAGEFKDKETVPDLIKVVDGFKGRNARTIEESQQVELQLDAIKSLGDIGDERAIPVLIAKLGKDENNVDIPMAVLKFGKKVFPQLLQIVSTTKDKDLENAAGWAIQHMTDKAIVPDLWKLLQEKGWYSMTVLFLADNTTTPTQDEVKAYLEQHADDKQHLGYLFALIEFAKKKKDINYLFKIAQDKNLGETPRTLAIEYLGDLQEQKAVPMLEDFFKNGYRGLSGSAATALEKITGRKCDREKRTYIQ